MPRELVTLICLSLFAAHAWLMLTHRQKMGSESSDRPQDPLYNRVNELFAFIFMFGAQLLALRRRLYQNYGEWDPNAGFLAKFCDFAPLPANDYTLLLGAALFVAGIGLRVWAIRILGRLFTFEIGIRSEHKIVEEGPYRYIRHPSYTGYLILLAGMGIAYASLFATLGMTGGALGFLLLRMRQEERMLIKHFGEPYREYMKRTKRLVPFVY
jgi:protein-S-isoprenylcysteine O-methyltransferase Ste14